MLFLEQNEHYDFKSLQTHTPHTPPHTTRLPLSSSRTVSTHSRLLFPRLHLALFSSVLSFQQVVPLGRWTNYPRIHSGDQLKLTCTYNTMSRKRITQGGIATTDEMCIDYLWYYPAAYSPRNTRKSRWGRARTPQLSNFGSTAGPRNDEYSIYRPNTLAGVNGFEIGHSISCQSAECCCPAAFLLPPIAF